MKRLLPCIALAVLLNGQELAPEQKSRIEAAIPTSAPAKPKKARRLLVTSLAKRGDQIIRGHPSIPAGKFAIEEMARRTGAFEAVFSDDVELFRPDRIRQFDAICFNNTQGVLFDDAELKKSLLDFVRNGGGIIGIHAVMATFVQHPVYDQWPEFGRLIGGTENGGHPWSMRDSYTFKVDDPKSPLTGAFKGQGFEINDEVMQLQEPNLRERMHVLLSIDMEKTPPPPGRMLPVRVQDRDFPLTWIRTEGKGRVFGSGIGHNASVFWNAPMMAHFLAGIQYALGDL